MVQPSRTYSKHVRMSVPDLQRKTQWHTRTTWQNTTVHRHVQTSVQVMKELQALAMRNELRFEVSKQAALAFLIKRIPHDLPALAHSISQRHGIVSRQQAHRLDVAYCSFAAAAAVTGPSSATYGDGGFHNTLDEVCWLLLPPAPHTRPPPPSHPLPHPMFPLAKSISMYSQSQGT